MDPRPAPRRVPALVGALGRRAWARGRVPIFRKITLYGKQAKSTHGREPTLYLPWSAGPTERRPRQEEDLPYTSLPKGQKTSQTKPNQPFPFSPYVTPQEVP